MANEFLDALSQREPASDNKSLFEKWLYGEPMVLQRPSQTTTAAISPSTAPVNPTTIAPVNPTTTAPKRITTPTIPQPPSYIGEQDIPVGYSQSGLTKEGVDAFDKAILEARGAEDIIKKAVKKSEQSLATRKTPAVVDYYTPSFKVVDTVEGTKDRAGLKQKIDEYDQMLKAGVDEMEKTKKTSEDEIASNQLAIKKNEEAKIKFLQDQLKTPPPEDKIDQGRLWANASLSAKMLLGISLALSARSNTAMDSSVKIINDAIERDIEEQKYENAQKALGRKTQEGRQLNLFDTYTNFYRSNVQAEQALRAKKWSELSKVLEMKAKGVDNQSAMVNAQKLVSIAEQTANQHQQDFYNNIVKEGDAQRKESFNNSTVLADAKLKTANAMINKAQALKQASSLRAGGQQGVKVPPPQTNDQISAEIYKTFKNDKKLYADAMAEAGTLKAATQGLSDLNKNFEDAKKISALQKVNPLSTSKAALTELETRVFLTLKNILGERFSDKDYEATVKPYIPSALTATDKQIDVLSNAVNSFVNNSVAKTPILEMYGIRQKMMNKKPIKRY